MASGKGGLRIFPLCRTASFLSLAKLILQIPINTPRHKPLYSIAYKRESGVLGIKTSRVLGLRLNQAFCVLGLRVLFLNDVVCKLNAVSGQ